MGILQEKRDMPQPEVKDTGYGVKYVKAAEESEEAPAPAVAVEQPKEEQPAAEVENMKAAATVRKPRPRRPSARKK